MRKAFPVYFFVLVLLSGCHPARNMISRTDTVPAGVDLQERYIKVFSSQDRTVSFSNQFAAGRLNHVTQENDSTFLLSIVPENKPVNPSPWYAFKVSASKPCRIYVKLFYDGFKHRYNPKIKSSTSQWREIGAVQLSKSKDTAHVRLEAGPDTLTVAAQEIITSKDSYKWMASLAAKPFIKSQRAGKSLMGKPVTVLHTSGSNGKRLVVVLSRQHPPEVTGYMAMQEFVETVTGDSDLARRFREQYELIVFPMMNPDGVDEGHWRHSAAGVDLNRDWEFFRQPEVRAVKDFLSRRTRRNAKVVFAIDFHSTFYDVFYTNSDTLNTNLPGFTNRWLAAFERAIPGFRPNVKPSGNGGNVSKSWMMRELKANALTYEVGDDTPRDLLKEKGRVAAEKMMEILLR